MAGIGEGNAMAYFFNIKKANSEIERLTALCAEQDAKVKELTESTPEALAMAESAANEAKAQVEKLSAELAAAQVVAGQLTKERDEAVASREVAIKQASTEASHKAAEIVAAQGAPAAVTNPQSNGNPAEQLAQITDPTERAKFIRANMSALFKAAQSPLKR